MIPEKKKPAALGGGLSKGVLLGGSEHREDSPKPSLSQPWTTARTFERQSIDCARRALTLRGADRFNALALASTYAVAARDAALIAGGGR